MIWQDGWVSSPLSPESVPVVVAKGIPYVPHANGRQRVNVYLPATQQNSKLVGVPLDGFPDTGSVPGHPRFLVHVHGGAWRDPALTATSIEPTVAHAFAGRPPGPITAVASIDYRLSPFPTHPADPYNPDADDHSIPDREAVHPQHVQDVLCGLALLRSFGVSDGSYVLSGHSCGACIAAQATLCPPRCFGLVDLDDPPRPAALLGLNGLYDLPALVDDLGPNHGHLRDEYSTLLSYAFGADPSRWPAASPARLDPKEIDAHIAAGKSPRLVVLDQSADDQLVPMNQKHRLAEQLGQAAGMRVVDGRRCVGSHAAPWERGDILWQSVMDVLSLLE